jgi:hypothetical protein
MRLWTRLLPSLAAALAAVSLTPAGARAGFIVSSQTVTAAPGSTGYVQILLTNDSATSQTLSGFSVDLALGGSGVRFTGVDDQTTPGYVFNGFGTGTLTFNLFPNAGFIGSDVSLNPDGFVTLAAGQTYGLARIAFEVDGTAAAGLRAITFTPGPTTQFTDAAGNPYAGSGVALTSGGIDVQAPDVRPVPAPGSAVLLLTGGGFGLCVAWRRRRQRTM